jgi:DNA-binding PucR family transcriptional regulator
MVRLTASLTLGELLELDVVRRTRPMLLHGEHGLDRPVRWVHTSELAEAALLLKGGELLLTTGLGLVGRGAIGQRAYVAALAQRRAAALAIELGWTFSEVPEALVEAARQYDVPLFALREIVPFVEITERAQTAILERRRPLPVGPDDGVRQRRRRLVQNLESGQREDGVELVERARLAGVPLTAAGPYLAVAVRGFPAGDDVAAVHAVEAALRPDRALAAEVDGDVLAVVHSTAADAIGRAVLDAVDQLSDRRGVARSARVVTGPAVQRLPDAGRSITDARRALSLAAGLGLPERRLAAPLMSARMILDQLAGDALAGRLVREEIGPLIEHDRQHGTALVDTLRAFLIHGSNKVATAAALHVRRQTLYQRLARITALIGDVGVPRRHTNLILAVELRAVRPEGRL